ncbi:hypothetical protein BH10CYA1_BH10CYA1_40030 [soil metagenome]
MDLLSLLNGVKQAIYDNPDTPHQVGNDPGELIQGIEKLFGQFGQHSGDGSVLPASRDPLGDPGQGFGNVKPASQDPLGDPG